MIEELIAWAQAAPRAPALIDAERSTSYGELLEQVRASATRLAQRGVQAGDTVALPLGQAGFHDEVARFYGAAWLGAGVLPLYPDVSPARRNALQAAFGAREIDLHSLDGRAGDAAADALRDARPERPFHYEFSSGTTGLPKTVLFSAGQWTTSIRVQLGLYGWRAGDRVMAATPWPSKVATRSLLRSHVIGGAYVNALFPDTRAELAGLVERFGVTCVRAVPAQLRILLASAAPARAAPLRFLDSAGTALAAREISAVRETLTANLHISYGTSESLMIAHHGPADAPDSPPRLMPGIEGQAVDEAHRALEAGATGVLRFRASWFPRAYASAPPESAERFRDGWFYPGDRGSVDAGGLVRLLGRTDDTINFGGLKVDPREIEEVLEAFPGVAEAAVAGAPDALSGEVPVAFVVLRGPIDQRALVQHCRAKLDATLVPQHILTLSRMPRNQEGKILRDELRKLYEGYKKKL